MGPIISIRHFSLLYLGLCQTRAISPKVNLDRGLRRNDYHLADLLER